MAARENKPRWRVRYRAQSDGREVIVWCSSKVSAERFADVVRQMDPGADPKVEEKE